MSLGLIFCASGLRGAGLCVVGVAQSAVLSAVCLTEPQCRPWLFPPLALLEGTGHVLFDYHSAEHGPRSNAKNIC